MRRILRLLTLWLFVLALPVQGALAATAMAARAGATSHATMVMPGGARMDADAMPCHGHGPVHAVGQSGCGDCCGPLVAQRALLAVAPVAARGAALRRIAADAESPQFLTGGTDRPPRRLA